jgi:hypothetical protein
MQLSAEDWVEHKRLAASTIKFRTDGFVLMQALLKPAEIECVACQLTLHYINDSHIPGSEAKYAAYYGVMLRSFNEVAAHIAQHNAEFYEDTQDTVRKFFNDTV